MNVMIQPAIRILVVDDEPAIRSALRIAGSSASMTGLLAGSSRSSLQLTVQILAAKCCSFHFIARHHNRRALGHADARPRRPVDDAR